MIPVPSGVQVWLACGHTDMRKGFDGLAVLVQETLSSLDLCHLVSCFKRGPRCDCRFRVSASKPKQFLASACGPRFKEWLREEL